MGKGTARAQGSAQPAEKDKRKPTKAYRRWCKRVSSIQAFLAEVDSMKALYGEDWVRGMTRHYLQELQRLYDNEPPQFED